MTDLLVVKDRVQRVLTDMFEVIDLTEKGFVVPYQSTACFIDFDVTENAEASKARRELELPLVSVTFWAVVAREVVPRSDMYEWLLQIATQYDYGSPKIVQQANGKLMVNFSFSIAGESADPMDIRNAVISVCAAADDLDEEFVSRFGGKTLGELRDERS